jgi:hypothetical protein
MVAFREVMTIGSCMLVAVRAALLNDIPVAENLKRSEAGATGVDDPKCARCKDPTH